MGKFVSVLVPVCDEGRLLDYTVPALFRLNVSEFVFVVDRKNGNKFTEERLRYHTMFAPVLVKKVFVDGDMGSDFRFRVAYLKWMGLRYCSYDAVLVIDADVVPDVKKINSNLSVVGDKMVCFEKVDYPLNLRYEVRKPFTFWMRRKATGTMLFDSRILCDLAVWEDNFDRLRSLVTGVDFFFHKLFVDAGFSVRYVGSRCVHLRRRTTSVRRYEYGRNSFRNLNRGFLRIFVSCLMSLDFVYLRGYLHERFSS